MAEKVYVAKESTSQEILSKSQEILNSVTASASSASIIKSVQRVTYKIPTKTTTDSISISEVNPEKCIVLFERLQDDGSDTTYIDYSLTATTLKISHRLYSAGSVLYTSFGFQIIEFY